jgi:hypothetical protein
LTALQTQFIAPLKTLLQERFVPNLLPLLGQGGREDKPEKQIARAFSAFVLQTRFNIDAKQAALSVLDDYNDNGIDAIYFDESSSTLYIVQSKFKAKEQFLLGEAQSFMTGVELLLDKNFAAFNQNFINKREYIENALDECEIIQLLVSYTGQGIAGTAKNELERKLTALIDRGEVQLQMQVDEFNAQEVEDALRAEQSMSSVNEKVAVYKCNISNEPRSAVFGVAKVNDLIALHDKYGKALYEKNIRYFIGAGRRGVNNAIKQTLSSNPKDFFFLNNGITMVGTNVEPKRLRSKGGPRNIQVLGLSVVNGAQTIASAAQFASENPDADISQAQVMVTIINTGNDKFHKQVTKARNLQNPVDLANFAALDDTQERLRQEIALFGVHYQYRPQQATGTGIRSISIDTLSKALACLQCDIRVPNRLKTEPTLFTNQESDAYQAIFTSDLQGGMAINAVNCYSVIQDLCTQAERSSPSPEKLVYRHFNYSIATLLMAQFKSSIDHHEIISETDFSTQVSQAFDELRQQFFDSFTALAAGGAPHAYFKRLSDTSLLMNTVWIEYLNLGQDQAVITKQQRLQSGDPYNQNLFNYLATKAQKHSTQQANQQLQPA